MTRYSSKSITSILRIALIIAALVLSAPLNAANYSIAANTDDNNVNSNRVGQWFGDFEVRIGKRNADGKNYVLVLPFALPDLQGESITSASLDLNFTGGSNNPESLPDLDLYGSTKISSSSSVADLDFYVDGDNPKAQLLQDQYVDTDVLINEGFGNVSSVDIGVYLQSLYDAGAQPNEHFFLIVAMDSIPSGNYKYLKVNSANSSNKPTLNLVTSSSQPTPVLNQSIAASANDGIINQTGITGYTGQNPERIGRRNSDGNTYSMVLPFQLPDLKGGTVTGAALSVNILGGFSGPPKGLGNIDLYGHIEADNFGLITDAKFYVNGETQNNPNVTLLQDDFANETELAENGWGVRTSVDISSFIQDFYDSNIPAGSYVYLILAIDQIPTSNYGYYNIESANGTIQPTLDLEVTGANEIGKTWGTTDRISQHGITWYFDRDYNYGTYVTGDYWVEGPITIIGIENSLNDPDYTPRLNQNGSMINPLANHSATLQGYDDGSSYDQSLNVALPGGSPISPSNSLDVAVNSSLVSTVSWLYNSPTDAEPGCPNFVGSLPRPLLRSAAVLTVVDSAPTDDSFRPPYAGADKSMDYQFSDLDLNKLSNLTPPTSGLPVLSELEAAMSRPWIDNRTTFWSGYFHPTDNMPNYGRDMAHVVNNTALMTNLDFSQLTGNPSKDQLVINLVQYGIDSTGVADNGPGWLADGGHMLGRKLPIIYAGILLNNAHMLNAGVWGRHDGTENGTGVSFQEYQTHFYVSQTEIDITQSGLIAEGGQWEPDSRDITEGDIIPYDSNYPGIPEWGIRHSFWPSRDNADLPIYYRTINGSVTVGTALAMQIMGAKSSWNNDVFFDYADRYWAWTGGGGSFANQPTALTKALWPMYRSSFPPVWSGDPDPSD